MSNSHDWGAVLSEPTPEPLTPEPLNESFTSESELVQDDGVIAYELAPKESPEEVITQREPETYNAIINEDVRSLGNTKAGIAQKIIGAFSDKKETRVSLLFVTKSSYRWYVYDLAKNEIHPVDVPEKTFSVYVWHDLCAFIEHKGSVKAVKKELLREHSITVDDIKHFGNRWYYYNNDFMHEMRSMGYGKLYCLQAGADALMEQQGLTPSKMTFVADPNVFVARIELHDGAIEENTLFNAERYAIDSVFSHLITRHKIDMNEQHVYESTFNELIKTTYDLGGLLLEERLFSLPILPINLSIIAAIGAVVFIGMSIKGANLVLSHAHDSRMTDKQSQLAELNNVFTELLAQKEQFIPAQLSINLNQFINDAYAMYQPGLRIDGTTDFTGSATYTAWWINGVTPLSSFINTQQDNACSVKTKVSGNGELAFKEIVCVHPNEFVGRFNPR